MPIKSLEVGISSEKDIPFEDKEAYVLRIIHEEPRPNLFGLSNQRVEELSLKIARGEIPNYQSFIEATFSSSTKAYKNHLLERKNKKK